MTEIKKVLVVDDDSDFLIQTEMMFSTRGYEVITAPGRKEAEETFDSFTPGIAVIDLMMENDDDGFVLAYRIKKRFPECVVIMVTNVTGETGIQFPGEDDSSGWINADAILSKPVRFEQIQEELNKIESR
ncbi:MAG: response regulator [Candidatus Sabulitectum sp.]|nr:response regulator [Candidatus Sabulitectum sp.]